MLQGCHRFSSIFLLTGVMNWAFAAPANARERMEPERLRGGAKDAFAECDNLAGKLAESTGDERAEIAAGLLRKAQTFSRQNPDVFRGWIWQAQAALVLDRQASGRTAGVNLLELGAAKSNNARVIAVLAALEGKGWLDK